MMWSKKDKLTGFLNEFVNGQSAGRCRLRLILAILFFSSLLFLVSGCASTAQPDPEQRRIIDTTSYQVVNEKSEPPVFEFHNRRGHHGQRISDSPIDKILVWQDGTIAWEIAGKDVFDYDTHWFQTVIPAEKVDQVVKDIVESFKNYPAENRPLGTRMFFRLGANFSPTITVMVADLYEFFWMDDCLYGYYRKNREGFQSENPDTVIEILKGMDNAFIDHTGLVSYYRAELPQVDWGAHEEKKISDDVLLKCAALFTADAEHLWLMEKRIFDLVPSVHDLKPIEPEYKSQNVKVEQEIKDGRRRFYYSPITKEEDEKIWEELRKQD